ncbi:MAG: GntR family transcriptional regulator [Anaerolineae bacterium]|nr:GntR family transcriptional regulator [Anaerolineae bacterium]
MTLRKPVRGTSLTDQTVDILIERIRNDVYPPQSQIPPEHHLAAEFSVSRATVRSAISVLADRGLVVRRNGIGTFVSQGASLTNPINEAEDFSYMIANNGFKPGVQHIKTQLVMAEPKIAEALKIEPNQPVFQEYKIFTADEEPVIFCINYMPTWMFDEALLETIVTHPESTEPLYDFLEERCHQRVEYLFSKIWPDIAQNCQFPDLPLEPITPVLVIDEISYNRDDIPLWYSLEYFPGNLMVLDLVRRRVKPLS